MPVEQQRYTLSLPSDVYEALRKEAEREGKTIKEVVSQCLKVGLVALRYKDDDNTGLFLRKKVSSKNDESIYEETNLMIF